MTDASKKASEEALGELHGAVARSLTEIITATGDEPPSAAHIAAAIAFLKHNNITADPATNADLNELNKALAARRKNRPALRLVDAEEELAAQLRAMGE